MTFHSKRDTWLVVVIWVGAVILLAAGTQHALQGRWIVATALGSGAAFTLWVLYGTRYQVSETHLRIRCGIFRWSIERASIVGIRASDDNASAPATSLDRLEIRYDNGRKRVLVSPARSGEFCAALGYPGPNARRPSCHEVQGSAR